MNTCLKLIMLVVVASASCFDALHAQDSRVVVLSNTVGAEIDKDERATYRLFQGMQGFHSAAVRHSGDSSFVIAFLLDDGRGGFRDSLAGVPYRAVAMLAETIDYFEALNNGRHVPGTGEVHLRYADGSPVVLPDPLADEAPAQVSALAAPAVREAPDETQMAQPRQSPKRVDPLPLASNKRGLQRPKFGTFNFAVSIDAMSMDIGAIEPLPGDKGKSTVSVSVRLGIHLLDTPSLRLLGGWTISVLHDIQNWNAFLLWQPVTFSTNAPLVGLGAGRINFNFTDHYYIRGSYSYPLYMVGWSLRHPMIDLLLCFPIGEVSTSFDLKTYTISPAGPTVTLMFSF